jgi:hypothetical protein
MSVSSLSFGQNEEDTKQFWEHVRFGGGIGLSFGNGFFSGTLAPSAIYQFNQDFGLGIGLNGTYNSLKNSYNSTILGASIISLYNPIPELQLSGELEQLNVSQKYEDSIFQDRNYWVPALFVGLGYRTNNVTFGMRYDFLYDRNKSIYADPWIPFVRVFF